MARKGSFPIVWALLAGILVFAFQGSRHIWDPDEGRYTNIALNMLESGKWLIPYRNSEEPHFTKPPLTYWALAASMEVFGRNEWGARFPNGLAFLGTLLVLLKMGRIVLSQRPWLPPLLYGLSLLPFGAANVVTTDTILTLWETLAGFSFIAWRNGAEEKRRKYLLLFWIALGLAFLTKGPPGLLPLPVTFIFLLITQGMKKASRLFDVLGLFLFCIVGLGWYALVIIKVPGLLDYLVENEFFGRIFTGMHHRNPQWYGSLVIYVPTFLLGSLPWTWLFLRKMGKIPVLLHPGFWRESRRKDPIGLYFLVWIFLPLPVFFLARSRLPFYILPLFAPLAVLLAREMEAKYAKAHLPWKGIIAWALLLLVMKFAFSFVPYEDDPTYLAKAIGSSAGHGVKEVVFLDTKPKYGLSFYLGVEVERVNLNRAVNFPFASQPQTLSQELSEREEGVLFLLKPWDATSFEAVVNEKGFRCKQMGKFGKYLFYEVENGS